MFVLSIIGLALILVTMTLAGVVFYGSRKIARKYDEDVVDMYMARNSAVLCFVLCVLMTALLGSSLVGLLYMVIIMTSIMSTTLVSMVPFLIKMDGAENFETMKDGVCLYGTRTKEQLIAYARKNDRAKFFAPRSSFF